MTGQELGPQDVGKIVVCPKCGEKGRVTILTFKAGGKAYKYLVVRHPRGAGKSKRCLIKRLDVAKVTKTEGSAAEVSIDVAVLKARVEQLERENAQLRAQLEALKPIEEWVMYAKNNSRAVGREESEALRLYYIKRKGYTEEQALTAKSILEPLIERGLSGELSTIVWGSLPSLTY